MDVLHVPLEPTDQTVSFRVSESSIDIMRNKSKKLKRPAIANLTSSFHRNEDPNGYVPGQHDGHGPWLFLLTIDGLYPN